MPEAEAEPRCPRCAKPLGKGAPGPLPSERWPDFPFCSERCRLVDLDHWFRGAYTIPGDTEVGENDSSSHDA